MEAKTEERERIRGFLAELISHIMSCVIGLELAYLSRSRPLGLHNFCRYRYPIRTSTMSSEHYYGRVAAGERPGNNSSMQLWSATSGARTATATATAATFPAATTSIIEGEGTASTTARAPDADAMFNDAALLLNAAARASREVSAAAPPGIASGAKHQPKNDEGKAEATRVVSMINGLPHELYAILPDAKTMVKVRIKVRVDIYSRTSYLYSSNM